MSDEETFFGRNRFREFSHAISKATDGSMHVYIEALGNEVRVLARIIIVALGRIYAEEICDRAGWLQSGSRSTSHFNCDVPVQRVEAGRISIEYTELPIRPTQIAGIMISLSECWHYLLDSGGLVASDPKIIPVPVISAPIRLPSAADFGSKKTDTPTNPIRIKPKMVRAFSAWRPLTASQKLRSLFIELLFQIGLNRTSQQKLLPSTI